MTISTALLHPRHTRLDTVLGWLTIAACDAGITGVWFEGHRYPPKPELLGQWTPAVDHELLADATTQLTDYLAGRRTDFDLTLAPCGAEFPQKVWARLRAVPRGSTTTYSELASEVGGRGYAQAVGQAVGHNPISIVIPCHRVIGAHGELTGYAGGLDRKRFLLHLEGAPGIA